MKKLISLIALTVVALQFSSIALVFAAPGSADIQISKIGKSGAGTLYDAEVCNDGDETVTSITFEVDATNFEVSFPFVAIDPNLSTATDKGSFIEGGLVWSGELRDTECNRLNFYGQETGELGEQITLELSIVSSILEGDIENVDPIPANDTNSHGPSTIVLTPDLSLNTRLLTQDEIVEDTLVSYEVIISNVGEGVYDNGMNVAFVVPSSAAFEEVLDNDLDDALDLDVCFPLGPPAALGPGLADLEGIIVLCQLEKNAPLAPNTSYSFTFTMTATQEFANGEVSVFVSVNGDDAETALSQLDIANGLNPVDAGYNNIAFLQYNNDELMVTINRCPGQNFVTNNGEGCFRVSFNKLIWEPSFAEDDLVLTGGGSIESLTKVNDFNWEVEVSDIPLNSTISLTLEESSVQDFSAVANGVEVLGENVIRYELEASSETSNSSSDTELVSGTLPKTGSDPVWQLAMLLIFLGIGLKRLSQSRYLDLAKSLRGYLDD